MATKKESTTSESSAKPTPSSVPSTDEILQSLRQQVTEADAKNELVQEELDILKEVHADLKLHGETQATAASAVAEQLKEANEVKEAVQEELDILQEVYNDMQGQLATEALKLVSEVKVRWNKDEQPIVSVQGVTHLTPRLIARAADMIIRQLQVARMEVRRGADEKEVFTNG